MSTAKSTTTAEVLEEMASLRRPVGRKSPALATLFAVLPGLGHIYNGLYMRGITFFLVIGSLITIADTGGHEILGFGVLFTWAFNVMDSYRQAWLINAGHAVDLGMSSSASPVLSPGQGGTIAGLALVAIGLFSLLDGLLGIQLDWLIGLWPLGIIGIGLWMVWSSLRERRNVPESLLDMEA